MARLAVIGGTSLLDSPFAADAERVDVAGVPLLDTGDLLFLQRHGLDVPVPAHRIDHARHVRALLAAGADRVLALSSTGSLRLDWPVGTVVAVDDFYAPHATLSLFDDARGHHVPGFDAAWRQQVVEAWQTAADTTIVDGGVYAETRGPRFETPAEVRALQRVADVVGMTVASECIVAGEAGLAYAAVCIVDNLANGLAAEPLTMEAFAAAVDANRARLLTELAATLPRLVEVTAA